MPDSNTLVWSWCFPRTFETVTYRLLVVTDRSIPSVVATTVAARTLMHAVELIVDSRPLWRCSTVLRSPPDGSRIAVDPAGKAWGEGGLIRHLGRHDWGGRGEGEGEGGGSRGGVVVPTCSGRTYVVNVCCLCLSRTLPVVQER